MQDNFQPVVEVENKVFIYINCGDTHSAAISDKGYVYTWGSGRHGKLCFGEHNFTTQYSPISVNRLRHLKALQVK